MGRLWRVSDCEGLSGGYSQEMTVKLKRNMETIMSIFLTWFPIGVLGELDI